MLALLIISAVLTNPAFITAGAERYATRTELHLPFRGRWLVLFDGRPIAQDARSAEQFFSYGFTISRNGRVHSGEGTRNEEYFCFGKPVLAPADAVVVALRRGLPDNEPGVMHAHPPLGNFVMLNHGDGEFSVLSHLQRGSIRVRRGESVREGALIGECGNSGRSEQPHLQFHLQSAPKLTGGIGLPAQFVDYVSGGEIFARGEPIAGHCVQRAFDTPTPTQRAK